MDAAPGMRLVADVSAKSAARIPLAQPREGQMARLPCHTSVLTPLLIIFIFVYIYFTIY